MIPEAVKKHTCIDESKNYLQLLSMHIKIDSLKKTMDDGELSFDSSISAEELCEPLISGRFSRRKLKDRHWILESLMFPADHVVRDPYESIFIASSYLHCHALSEAGHIELGAMATAYIVTSCRTVESPVIISAIGFIESLNHITMDIERRDSDPRIYYRIAVASLWQIIIHRILSDIPPGSGSWPVDESGFRVSLGEVLWLKILDKYRSPKSD